MRWFSVCFALTKKVDEVQTNARLLKRAEVAEDLIALSLNVEDAMKDIRNPLDRVPAEKAGERRYHYQRRYERVAKYNDLFQRLRDAQIRERAIIGDPEVNKAVDDLFRARNDILIAIQILADFVNDDRASKEDREHQEQLGRTLYGSFSDRDKLGKSISTAVETIEKKLRSFARLDVSVKI